MFPSDSHFDDAAQAMMNDVTSTSRRGFLAGCSAAIAAMAGSRLGYLGFADAATADASREVLVVVFLRGGMDGLSLIPPIGGVDRRHYEEARPSLKIPVTGPGAALRLDDQFGLHPAAAPLLPLFQGGKLAVVHAVGNAGSRSHFEAQKYIELGTPGGHGTETGWLTRHLLSSPVLGTTAVAPALATGTVPPTSLQSSNEAIYLNNASTFNLSAVGHSSWAYSDQRIAMRRIFAQGGTIAHGPSLAALNAAGIVENYFTAPYKPADGVTYPVSDFSSHLKLIAQMIKLNVGLQVATVDLGGWDTHEQQGNLEGGQFWNLTSALAGGLAAFYADLDGASPDSPAKRLTVVVQSEFGRRITENSVIGTDHGTGNVMLVLGGNVRGGFHGVWPGLDPAARYDGVDLAPTTDFRQILSEILIRRLANPRIGKVFPKYESYAPINIVVGDDLPPEFGQPLPTVPTGFTASRPAQSGPVSLNWTPVEDATGYRIERRDSATAPWRSLVSLGGFATSYEDGSAPAGPGLSYRIQALGAYGTGEFGEPVGVAASAMSPIEEWRMQHFGTAANTGDAANDRVLTSDGLSNFTKYALGLDPRVVAGPAKGFTPGLPVTQHADGVFSLVYVRPVGRSDVRYEVRLSSDLGVWTAVPDVSDGTSGGMERRRASVSMVGKPAQFLTLRVQPAA